MAAVATRSSVLDPSRIFLPPCDRFFSVGDLLTSIQIRIPSLPRLDQHLSRIETLRLRTLEPSIPTTPIPGSHRTSLVWSSHAKSSTHNYPVVFSGGLGGNIAHPLYNLHPTCPGLRMQLQRPLKHHHTSQVIDQARHGISASWRTDVSSLSQRGLGIAHTCHVSHGGRRAPGLWAYRSSL